MYSRYKPDVSVDEVFNRYLESDVGIEKFLDYLGELNQGKDIDYPENLYYDACALKDGTLSAQELKPTQLLWMLLNAHHDAAILKVVKRLRMDFMAWSEKTGQLEDVADTITGEKIDHAISLEQKKRFY